MLIARNNIKTTDAVVIDDWLSMDRAALVNIRRYCRPAKNDPTGRYTKNVLCGQDESFQKHLFHSQVRKIYDTRSTDDIMSSMIMNFKLNLTYETIYTHAIRSAENRRADRPASEISLSCTAGIHYYDQYFANRFNNMQKV